MALAPSAPGTRHSDAQHYCDVARGQHLVPHAVEHVVHGVEPRGALPDCAHRLAIDRHGEGLHGGHGA